MRSIITLAGRLSDISRLIRDRHNTTLGLQNKLDLLDTPQREVTRSCVVGATWRIRSN